MGKITDRLREGADEGRGKERVKSLEEQKGRIRIEGFHPNFPGENAS